MTKFPVLFFLYFLSLNFVVAQNLSDKTLLTISNNEVKVSEFEKVYEKNLDLVQDPSQKEIDNYFPLFVSYKKKLMQAKELGLDTTAAYTKELSGYRKDLAAPYFKDPKEEEKLLKEAYERSQYEIKVSHILIMVSEDASAADTAKAYKKLLSIRKEIIAGKISFENAAVKYSEDPSAKKNHGELNWMTVFYMVYHFESGAYNTNVGEVSMPVRTSYGYHLAKVIEKRKSSGKVQVAHIILRTDRPGISNRDSMLLAKKILADTIYAKLEKGEKFTDLARTYSDDNRSAMNGGMLPALGVGKLMPEMEKVAFSLEDGEFSKPYLTKFGWDILKVVKRYPILSYEESKESLSRELKKDNRSKYIEKSVIDHLKVKYTITPKNKIFEKVEKNIDSLYLSSGWKYKSELVSDVILVVEKENVSALSYIKFLEENPVNAKNKYSLSFVLASKRKEFIDKEILRYYDNNLENEYSEFQDVMSNYREGILIYNLMNEKIWGKSYSDTLGLEKFYEKNKSEYMWPERADLILVKAFNEEAATKAKKYLKKGKSKEYIEEKLNKGSNIQVTVQSGIITDDNEVLPEGFEWKKGVSKIYKKSDTDFVIVDVKAFVKPQVKTLEESEGSVRVDYQNYLEAEWNKELKDNYEVTVDEKVYSSMKKKYNQ